MDILTECNGILRPCCGDEANRVEVKREQMEANLMRVTEECRICTRRHYTLLVPPIRFGVEGARL